MLAFREGPVRPGARDENGLQRGLGRVERGAAVFLGAAPLGVEHVLLEGDARVVEEPLLRPDGDGAGVKIAKFVVGGTLGWPLAGAPAAAAQLFGHALNSNLLLRSSVTDVAEEN